MLPLLGQDLTLELAVLMEPEPNVEPTPVWHAPSFEEKEEEDNEGEADDDHEEEEDFTGGLKAPP